VKARVPITLIAILAVFIAPAFLTNVHASGCNSGCQVSANSNVPPTDGRIWVQVDNNTGSYCSGNQCILPLPQTFTFPNASSHSIQVLNSSFTGASTGGQYAWKYWTIFYGTPQQTVWPTTNEMLRLQQVVFNYTGTASFTAVFDKQYKYTMSFSDSAGNPLSPAPSNVTLQPQSGSAITVTSYSQQFLSSNIYKVTGAFWEGTSVTTVGTQTLDLSNGPATLVVPLTVYPTTVHVVDSNNNPVSGASVTITFLNNTSRAFVSNSNGDVRLGGVAMGSYSATVRYQNQQYGPYTLTSVGNPINTVQVNSGTPPPNTTTTAIALLAIFGIAFFLILLAIKVRKPAAPPQI
jgi:Carboxypeptidase regulatory-like domain